MPLRIWIAGLLIGAGNIGPAIGQPGNVEAVELAGPGVLTKCRGWLVASRDALLKIRRARSANSPSAVTSRRAIIGRRNSMQRHSTGMAIF